MMTHLPIFTCNIFLTLFLEFSSFIKTRIPNYQKINQYESFANWNRHVLLSRHYVRVVRLMQIYSSLSLVKDVGLIHLLVSPKKDAF